MYLNRIYIGYVLYFCTVSQGYFRVSLSVQGGSINYVLCIIWYILYQKAVTEFSLSVQTLLGGSIYYLLYIICYILYHKAVTEFSMSLGWKKHILCTMHHISYIISQGTGWRKQQCPRGFWDWLWGEEICYKEEQRVKEAHFNFLRIKKG